MAATGSPVCGMIGCRSCGGDNMHDRWLKKSAVRLSAKACIFAAMLVLLALPAPLHGGGNYMESAKQKIAWAEVLQQSGLFLGLQNSVRIAYEPETRKELVGPFFGDYFESLSGLHGWNDDDPFAVNYLGHPWMGAVAGRIFVHNDPAGNAFDFDSDPLYWKSRLKAMGWSAVYSTVFELSPVGEAAIGNIGGAPWPNGLTYCDLVITPVLGTAVLVGEDIADRYAIRWIEKKSGNVPFRAAMRVLINPSRSVANLMRFKWPWHRDARPTSGE